MTRTQTNSKTIQFAGSCLFASGLVFLLFTTIAEAIYPNYSVGSDALSALGAIGTDTFLLWNSQLFVSGVLWLSGMYFLFYKSELRSFIRRTNLVGILYLLPAVGAIIVSLFQENSTIGFVGGHNLLHIIGAFTAFAFGGISAIYAYKLTKGPFRYFSVLLGVITLISIPLFLYSAASVYGLTERLIVYPSIVWEICFGTYLMALNRDLF
jgi:hypothetical membrane protein